MMLDRIAAYWDTRAEGYSEGILGEIEDGSAERFREYFRQALPEGECLDVLDMGCGPGLFTLLLNEMGHRVVSADYSPQMLARTRENCAAAGYVANAVRADAQNLPFADGSFDFVCSRNLVWNLEKPERAYAEWMRVLKPHGRLFVCDGNHYLYYYNEDYRRAREMRIARGIQPDHSTKGVDPTPINNIARDLPLSHEVRPEWDERVLGGMGLKLQKVERVTECFMDGEAEKVLTHSFVLWGEKDG